MRLSLMLSSKGRHASRFSSVGPALCLLNEEVTEDLQSGDRSPSPPGRQSSSPGLAPHSRAALGIASLSVPSNTQDSVQTAFSNQH